MKRAYGTGDVTFHCCFARSSAYELAVYGSELKALNDEVNKLVCGLCLTCLRTSDDTSECTHRQLLQRWVENDLVS
jgi:polyferredoxin